MIIRLEDGTQEFISKPEDFQRLISERLGRECEDYIRDMIQEIEDLHDPYCGSCSDLEDQVTDAENYASELEEKVKLLEAKLEEAERKK